VHHPGFVIIEPGFGIQQLAGVAEGRAGQPVRLAIGAVAVGGDDRTGHVGFRHDAALMIPVQHPPTAATRDIEQRNRLVDARAMHPVSQHGAGSGIAGRGAQTRVAGRRQSVLPPVGRCLRPRIKAIDQAVEAGQIAIDIGIIVHRRVATAEQLSGDYRDGTINAIVKCISFSRMISRN
jgi:hypothetical protein